jgi:hypothetical protein
MDPRFTAAVDLLGHTGADGFQIRCCEEEDPPVWIAALRQGKRWQAAGALHPLDAVFRLCDAVIDGGLCTHCGRAAGFSPDFDPMPLDALICWYQWDPELAVFRRSCSGGTAPGNGK